jgi:hypothetical protein
LKFGPFIAIQNHEGSGFSAQVAPICTAGESSPQITQRAGQWQGSLPAVSAWRSYRTRFGTCKLPTGRRQGSISSDLAMVYRKSERAPAIVRLSIS